MTVIDKMDIINLSLTGNLPYPDTPVIRALNKAFDAGIVVVVAVGNGGVNGLWTTGSPSTGVNTIGAASFDNVKYPGQSFTINENKGISFVAGYEGLEALSFKDTPFVIAQTEGRS